MPGLVQHLSAWFGPAQERQYVHLPFEMPEAATRLEVSYEYSAPIDSDPLATGGNTVDLAVFDTGGIEFLSAGFRGGSGSARSGFVITEHEATPGYLPGPLSPGTWHVMLGLYKIAPQGCECRVTVTIAAEPGQPATGAGQAAWPARLPGSLPPAAAGRWVPGELHAHTVHSDGTQTPAGLVGLARRQGLEFLAVTDHNTLSGRRELAALPDPGLLLIPGVEVTTFWGHFNVWGSSDWIDFRIQTAADLTASLKYAQARGLTCCNHPKPNGPPWEFAGVGGYDCIEVWNGPWQAMNDVSLAFWADRLAAGQRIPALGGSDYHRQEPPGKLARLPGIPTTWAYLPESNAEGDALPPAERLLAALRAGHVVLTATPDAPFLHLQAAGARPGDTLPAPPPAGFEATTSVRLPAPARLRLVDQSQVLLDRLLPAGEQRTAVHLDPERSRLVRAELRAENGDMLCLTNPIYLGSAAAT